MAASEAGAGLLDDDASSYVSALVLGANGLFEESESALASNRAQGSAKRDIASGSRKDSEDVANRKTQNGAACHSHKGDANGATPAQKVGSHRALSSNGVHESTAAAGKNGWRPATEERINAYLDDTLVKNRPASTAAAAEGPFASSNGYKQQPQQHQQRHGANTVERNGERRSRGHFGGHGDPTVSAAARVEGFPGNDERAFFVETGSGGGGLVQVLPEIEGLHHEVMDIKRQIGSLSQRVRRQKERAALHHQLPDGLACTRAGGSTSTEAARTPRSVVSSAAPPPPHRRHASLTSEERPHVVTSHAARCNSHPNVPDSAERRVGSAVTNPDSSTARPLLRDSTVSSARSPATLGGVEAFVDEEDDCESSRIGARSAKTPAPLPQKAQDAAAEETAARPSEAAPQHRKLKEAVNEDVEKKEGTALQPLASGAEPVTVSLHADPRLDSACASHVPSHRSSSGSLSADSGRTNANHRSDGDSPTSRGADTSLPSSRGRHDDPSQDHARDTQAAALPLSAVELEQLQEDIRQLEKLYEQRGALLKEIDALLRQHADRGERWEADEERVACYRCQRLFSGMTTRHHCRRCGRLCCGQCSQYFGTKQDTSVRGQMSGDGAASLGAAVAASSGAPVMGGGPADLYGLLPRSNASSAAAPFLLTAAPNGANGPGSINANTGRQIRVTVKSEYVARMTADDGLDERESRFDTCTYPVSLTPPLPPSALSASTTTAATTTPGTSAKPSATAGARATATDDGSNNATGADTTTTHPCNGTEEGEKSTAPALPGGGVGGHNSGYDETDINDPDTVLREEESSRRSRNGLGSSLGTSPILSFSSHLHAVSGNAMKGGGGGATAFQLPPHDDGAGSFAQQQQQQQQQKLQHSEVRLCSVCYYNCLGARKTDLVKRLRSANRYILDDGYYYYHVLSGEELANFSIVMRKPGTVRKRAELMTSVAFEKTADVAAAVPQYVRQRVVTAAQQAPQVLRTIGTMSTYTMQKTKAAAKGYLASCGNGVHFINGGGGGSNGGNWSTPSPQTATATDGNGDVDLQVEDDFDIISVKSDSSTASCARGAAAARASATCPQASAPPPPEDEEDGDLNDNNSGANGSNDGIVESGPIRGVPAAPRHSPSNHSHHPRPQSTAMKKKEPVSNGKGAAAAAAAAATVAITTQAAGAAPRLASAPPDNDDEDEEDGTSHCGSGRGGDFEVDLPEEAK